MQPPYPQKEDKIAEIVLAQQQSLQIKKNHIIRLLYIVGGSIAFGLSILGLFVPGLPSAPFALLSAALYAKSSPKLYQWILNNKILGPRILNYKRRKGMTQKGKLGILALMTTMVLVSSLVVVRNIPLRFTIDVSLYGFSCLRQKKILKILITKIKQSDFQISKIVFLHFFRQKFNIEYIGCLSYIFH